MSNSILVTFSTIYGSTQEVAEQIAATLREHGNAVDLQPIKQVRSLDQYRAVVLGAPLYMFHWHKDALNFLSRYRTALARKPVAIFALGPLNNVEKEFQEARAMLDKELAKFTWFAPVAIEMFGGRMEPAKFRFPHNLIPAMNKMPASDIRDWTAIRTWASNLSTKLESV
ncbi:menaquinone-dependent protoporphyrinogen oxidase [Anaerolineae bacterium]|nr:menaquinone-dependent protoporphyrinogen oxidase [Anaerolineae bacterium]